MALPGLEPGTLALLAQCSNRLSYKAKYNPIRNSPNVNVTIKKQPPSYCFKKRGNNESWTRVTGFGIRCDNHYTRLLYQRYPVPLPSRLPNKNQQHVNYPPTYAPKRFARFLVSNISWDIICHKPPHKRWLEDYERLEVDMPHEFLRRVGQ